MKQSNRLNQMGATPGKLALIAALALVLVFVIVRQLPSSNQQQAKSNRGKPATSKKKVELTQAVPEVKPEQAKRLTASWPNVDMSELLVNDPFATPAWAAKPKPEVDEEKSTQLVELQKQGVSVVMITNAGKSASIGERNVRVGDVLEGYQITDINTQGIVLHKLSSH